MTLFHALPLGHLLVLGSLYVYVSALAVVQDLGPSPLIGALILVPVLATIEDLLIDLHLLCKIIDNILLILLVVGGLRALDEFFRELRHVANLTMVSAA